MSNRLPAMLKMLEREPNDAFLLYGVGIELKNSGDTAGALQKFARVIEVDPGYCYAYFQAAQVQEGDGNLAAARASLEAGIAAAKQKDDAHALSELSGALEMLG